MKRLYALMCAILLVGCDFSSTSRTPQATSQSSNTDTIPSVATEFSHETFAVTGEQAQEIAVFMAFIQAYNNGQLDEALARLSEDVGGSDCDYRKGTVVSFQGKSEAAEWLLNRFAEYDRLEVSRIYNENPAPSGESVIGVEYSRRSNTTLAELGFSKGITPKLATKVIFAVAPTLISSFANGSYGGEPNECRPGS